MARREQFDELVARRSAALLRTAVLLAGDHHTGEDLLQATLQRTYSRWWRVDDAAAGEAYARRVMVNLATRWWRRKWRAEMPTAELPEGVETETYAHADQRLMLRRVLASLPARQRAVVVLRYYDDLSEAQTAELLGVSVGTVKNTCHKALARLRAELGADNRLIVLDQPTIVLPADGVPEVSQ